MVLSKKEYRDYLQNNFNGLQLKAPLFFNGTLGLRFNLQKGETGSDEYLKEVIKRSAELFNSSFSPTDTVIVKYIDFKWKRRKIKFSNYCFKQIEHLNKCEVVYSTLKSFYESGDNYNMAVIKTAAATVNYKNILTAIANTDFPPRKPRFEFLSGQEVYFINISRNLIFHMYDDRGLDIIAADLVTLRPIYLRYNDWILEANREKIDKMMS